MPSNSLPSCVLHCVCTVLQHAEANASMCELFRSVALLPIDLLTRVLPLVLCAAGFAGLGLGGALGLFLLALRCAAGSRSRVGQETEVLVREGNQCPPVVGSSVERVETYGSTDAVREGFAATEHKALESCRIATPDERLRMSKLAAKTAGIGECFIGKQREEHKF